MISHGEFHWNELMTRDVAKAKSFYAKTIGWDYKEMPMAPDGVYHIAMAGEKPACGILEMTGEKFEGVAEHWMSYLYVDDVDARIKNAATEGATILNEPFNVPGVGRIAILKDGGGAVLGWITPADMTLK